MATYLTKARPAVSDHHRPDLLQQRLDGGRLTPGRQRGQIAKAGRLARPRVLSYLLLCFSGYGQIAGAASLGHESIMPR